MIISNVAWNEKERFFILTINAVEAQTVIDGIKMRVDDDGNANTSGNVYLSVNSSDIEYDESRGEIKIISPSKNVFRVFDGKYRLEHLHFKKDAVIPVVLYKNDADFKETFLSLNRQIDSYYFKKQNS